MLTFSDKSTHWQGSTRRHGAGLQPADQGAFPRTDREPGTSNKGGEERHGGGRPRLRKKTSPQAERQPVTLSFRSVSASRFSLSAEYQDKVRASLCQLPANSSPKPAEAPVTRAVSYRERTSRVSTVSVPTDSFSIRASSTRKRPIANAPTASAPIAVAPKATAPTASAHTAFLPIFAFAT
jgi:hypothetical protein